VTSFEELLVRQMTQKVQQNRWKEPSVGWDRTKAHERLESKKAMGKQVTWVSKRESYLSSLCIVFS